jgi:hypothetical protein
MVYVRLELSIIGSWGAPRTLKQVKGPNLRVLSSTVWSEKSHSCLNHSTTSMVNIIASVSLERWEGSARKSSHLTFLPCRGNKFTFIKLCQQHVIKPPRSFYSRFKLKHKHSSTRVVTISFLAWKQCKTKAVAD